METDFIGMPRMQKFFNEVIYGKCTESAEAGGRESSEKSRNEDGRSEHCPSDRDTEIDNVSVQEG